MSFHPSPTGATVSSAPPDCRPVGASLISNEMTCRAHFTRGFRRLAINFRRVAAKTRAVGEHSRAIQCANGIPPPAPLVSVQAQHVVRARGGSRAVGQGHALADERDQVAVRHLARSAERKTLDRGTRKVASWRKIT